MDHATIVNQLAQLAGPVACSREVSASAMNEATFIDQLAATRKREPGVMSNKIAHCSNMLLAVINPARDA